MTGRRFVRTDQNPHFARTQTGPSPAARNHSRNLTKLGRNTGRSRLTKPDYA